MRGRAGMDSHKVTVASTVTMPGLKVQLRHLEVTAQFADTCCETANRLSLGIVKSGETRGWWNRMGTVGKRHPINPLSFAPAQVPFDVHSAGRGITDTVFCDFDQSLFQKYT